ncbi:MAG: cation-transporting P-type ATPase [Candidatus Thalassarchaeaceae archaeon]|jgi:Ca2+-transporting ATPase|nr:cation-transporting P-type ATPase [Candidatus Thalassarchaeaceae archaeon]
MESDTEVDNFQALSWHSIPISDVLENLGTTEEGLTSEEVLKRRDNHGENKLDEKPPIPKWVRFLEQFRDPMVYLLMLAAVIATIFEPEDIGTPIFIVFALTLNAFFGYIQEAKAEEAMDSLKKLLVCHCVAIRNGTEEKVSIEELVPGDIIWLEDGLNVPADIRLVEVHQLQIDESSLTGESDSIHKSLETCHADAILQEQSNMCFMGTVTSSGRAKAVVVRTGMKTVLGGIASGISDVTTPKTPLEIKLHSLGSILGFVAVTIAVLLLGLQVVSAWFSGDRGNELYEVMADQFLVAVAIFVAIVPEGLPIILVVTLAMGMRNMARQKAIVRRMKAVETLGSTTIICTDKTGTLTRNEMTVRSFLFDGVSYGVSGRGFDPTKGRLQKDGMDIPESELAELYTNQGFRLTIATSLLCQNSNVKLVDDEWQAIGDPTDSACAVFGWKMRESVDTFRRKHPRFREYTFDRNRKRMTTIHEFDGERWAFSKGALGPFMQSVTDIYENGSVVPIEARHKDIISEVNLDYASRALRVLALCARKITSDVDIESVSDVESDMIFLGLVGIMDPPRPEVPDSISKCHEAGIRVMMITGDQRMTAMAVGREIGIVIDDSDHMSGKELRECTDEMLDERLDTVAVFSRVTPDQKLRIVERLQSSGHVVAMTGDGDNDAPALSQANIGVAMGLSGTDVARDASDMVLQDDNFSNIVSAVEEGRKIYLNIRNFVRYQISTNVAAVLLILVSTFIFGWDLPLTPTQLLVINILMDGPPAVALGIERRHSNVMAHPPRRLNESLPSPPDMVLIAFLGLIMVIGTVAVFWFSGGGIISGDPCTEFDGSIEEEYLDPSSGECIEGEWEADAKIRFNKAQTMAFSVFVIYQLFNVLNCRSMNRSIFQLGVFNNKAITISFAISTVFLLLMVQGAAVDLPFIGINMGQLLSVVPLTLEDWAIIFAIASSVFLADELRKLIFRSRDLSRMR